MSRVPSRACRVALTVTRIVRVPSGDGAGADPPIWTLLDVEVADRDVDLLVAQLTEGLAEGWYAALRSEAEPVVVFRSRVFRYPRGDEQGRAAAVAHGRSLGIPDEQLDWPA